MPIFIFGFALGIALIDLFSLIKIVIVYLSLLSIAALFFFLWSRCSWRSHIIKFTLAMTLGLFWVYLHLFYVFSWHLPTHLVNKNILITGKIIAISFQNNLQKNFIFQTTQLNHKFQSVRLRLNWYAPSPKKLIKPQFKLVHNHFAPLLTDNTWQLMVRLKPPHGLQNPGSFNYSKWLSLHGIQATGYVVNSDKNYKMNSHQFFLMKWRQFLQTKINQVVPNSEIAALLSALTVGIRDGFTPNMWNILQATGTNHLVVIAGLHLGILTTMLFTLFYFLYSLCAQLLLIYPAKRLAALTTLLIVWMYALLSGFSIPTQRALCLLTLFMLNYFSYRHVLTFYKLFMAAGIILLLDPLALFDMSFWLSFSTCLWIIYGMLGWHDYGKIVQWLRVQWIIVLGILPLTLYFFQQVALTAIIANSIAIPWVGFLIMPLGLMASLLTLCHLNAGPYLFYWAGKCLVPLWHILQWVAEHPEWQWHHQIVQPWILVTSYVGILLFLAPSGIPGRWLGVFWLLPLFFYRLPAPGNGQLWLTVLDVGQGLSVVMRTTHHTLIYDTGPRTLFGFDAGKDIVIPYLQREKVSRVDLLMVSHGDNDHSGGAKAILQSIPVTHLITSIPALFETYHPKYCYAGQHWHWDGWKLTVLSPKRGVPYLDNNSSCVLQITHKKQRVLLTGDIEAQTETQLITQYGSHLKSDIIVVPHHGSKTSSTESFVKMVHPHYALFSLGFYNRFHFPDQNVVAHYKNSGSKVLFTASSGAMTLKLNPQSVPIKIEVQNINKIR